MNAPLPFTWTGEVMEPHARAQRFCDKAFVVGETYPLIVHEERSGASHSHYFAALNEAWRNLPDDELARFPSAEHLRKWALCKAGYADERSIVCATKAEAQRVAAFVKPLDAFAVVSVRDAVVKVYTAQSQSTRAMDKATFQKSKQDVLDIVAGLIGVDAQTLSFHVGPSARNERTEQVLG